jgi:hypothetical protein
VYDALRRKYQCATVQLDFQLPIRFNLEYVAEDGQFQRPVIVHRSVGRRGSRQAGCGPGSGHRFRASSRLCCLRCEHLQPSPHSCWQI